MKFRKTIIEHMVRPFFEAFNIDTYSRPSLNNLDRKLEKYVDYDNGIFLEIGANDGFKQSNTYYFEKIRNWKGVLVEPIPKLFEQCCKARKKSEVFNFLCSNPDDSGTYKTIQYADLMSQVKGAFLNHKNEENHINRGLRIQKIDNTFEVKIICKTLSEIINESNFSDFDFMSVDVEGYEFEVLKGLNLDKHAPKFLLIETWDHEKQAIINYLSGHFVVVEYLTEKDILFGRK